MGRSPIVCSTSSSSSSASRPGRSHLLTNVSTGMPRVAADVEELEGLRLQALGRVEQHHRGVDGGQHPVGVLGEVAVARGVQQVDHVVAVGELQHRRGDRDAALALHVHPVRGDPAPAAPCRAPRPAASITSACRASASVSVDLPASGWLITANVRRRCACVPGSSAPSTPAAAVTAVIALLLRGRQRPTVEGTTALRTRDAAPAAARRARSRSDRRTVDVGAGVDEREVVVPGVHERLGGGEVGGDLGPAPERLAHVLGGDVGGRGVEVDGVRQLGLHLPARDPEAEQPPRRLRPLLLGGRVRDRHLGVAAAPSRRRR